MPGSADSSQCEPSYTVGAGTLGFLGYGTSLARTQSLTYHSERIAKWS
jgi:hypothetical protein